MQQQEKAEEVQKEQQQEVSEGEAYTWQGTLPTLTATSSLLAVSRSVPVMVMTVPPATGPLDGSTLVGLGSWW